VTGPMETPQVGGPVETACACCRCKGVWHSDWDACFIEHQHGCTGGHGKRAGCNQDAARPDAPAPVPSDEDRWALSNLLMSIYDHGTQPNAVGEADAILAAGFARSSQPAPSLGDLRARVASVFHDPKYGHDPGWLRINVMGMFDQAQAAPSVTAEQVDGAARAEFIAAWDSDIEVGIAAALWDGYPYGHPVRVAARRQTRAGLAALGIEVQP